MPATAPVLGLARVTALRPESPDDDWDVQLERAGGHFLQSLAWQRVQRRLGYAVVAERRPGWLWTGSVRVGAFPRYLYVPYGPAGGDLDAALQSVADAARERRLDFARVEPLAAPSGDALARLRARRVKPVQPRWTSVLDLTQTEEALRRGLSAGHRGSINAAPRRGIVIARNPGTASAETFVALERATKARTGYAGRRPGYYRAILETLQPLHSASLYVAEAAGSVIAAAICFDFASTRYYAYAASDPVAGRKLGAAVPLVWRMILDARSEGRRVFDFWGVAPPGAPDHRWAGFTQFKRAFGGRLLERPGAWELEIHALRHRLFSLAQTVRR